jgi:hypothetical protein
MGVKKAPHSKYPLKKPSPIIEEEELVMLSDTEAELEKSPAYETRSQAYKKLVRMIIDM